MKKRREQGRPAQKKRQAKPLRNRRVPRRSLPAARERSRAPAFPIVGVGASAGGLEAFIQLLGHMPADTGMAFVVIQHLDPRHPSLLCQTLARATKMKVSSAANDMLVRPDEVYVIPPDAELSIARGRLILGPRRHQDRKPHLPIDRFFRALATERGSRAIGVVLSGTASDGTEGLRAIRAEGGITFAQDPESARFAGMPESAVEAGVVDHCLPVPALAVELLRLARHPFLVPAPATAPGLKDDGSFGKILGLVE